MAESYMSEPKKAKFSHPQGKTPKTSEYAFFEKLKKDIGSIKSRPLHKVNNQSKISKANGQNREISASFSIRRSSYSSEREGPSDKFAFRSPIAIELNNLGTEKGTSRGINQRSSGFDKNLLPSASAGAGKILGNQYAEKDIFSAKRQRLRQLAADLFPEVGVCNTKGFDLVSALISRLLPRGNESEEGSCWDDVLPRYQLSRLRQRVLSKHRDNEAEHSHSKGRMIDAEYPSAAFLKLDTPEKTYPKNASKIQHESCWDDVFPNYQSSRPRERVLSKWYMTTSDIPCIKYNVDAATDFQGEEANDNCGIDGGSIQYTFPESDSSFCVLFQNYRNSGTDHIKQLYGFHAPQLDGFQAPIEPARGEAHSLLLSWDVKDYKGKNLYSTSGNSLEFACQQIMDDNIEEITTCSPSLYSNHSLDFFLRPYIHSTRTYMHDMGGNHQDDSAVAVADILPLSLSLPPKHLSVEEDGDIFNHFENYNINLPQQDPPWCTINVPGKKGDFEALLLSRGLDIDPRWKCLPRRDFLETYSSNKHIFQFPFEEDLCSYAVEETVLYCLTRDKTLASYDGVLGNPHRSSASFNVSLGKKLDHPLLLDYPDTIITEESSP